MDEMVNNGELVYDYSYTSEDGVVHHCFNIITDKTSLDEKGQLIINLFYRFTGINLYSLRNPNNPNFNHVVPRKCLECDPAYEFMEVVSSVDYEIDKNKGRIGFQCGYDFDHPEGHQYYRMRIVYNQNGNKPQIVYNLIIPTDMKHHTK